MATWRRIDPIGIDDTINRVVTTEVWLSEDLSDDRPDIDELIDSVPVQKNQPHPDPKYAQRGCQCIGKRLVYGPLRKRAKVLVTYDSYIRFRLALPFTNRSNSAVNEDWIVPIVQSSATTYDPISGLPLDGTTQMVLRKIGVRVGMRRVVSYNRTGNADLIAAAITPNLNKRYFLRLRNGAQGPPFTVEGDEDSPDGIQIVLVDFSVTDLSNGFNRVTYEFRWYGPCKEIKGSDIGSLSDLPALKELEQYDIDYSNPSAAIGVLKAFDLYDIGGPLP